MCDDVRGYVVEHLTDPDAVLVVMKRGTSRRAPHPKSSSPGRWGGNSLARAPPECAPSQFDLKAADALIEEALRQHSLHHHPVEGHQVAQVGQPRGTGDHLEHLPCFSGYIRSRSSKTITTGQESSFRIPASRCLARRSVRARSHVLPTLDVH